MSPFCQPPMWIGFETIDDAEVRVCPAVYPTYSRARRSVACGDSNHLWESVSNITPYPLEHAIRGCHMSMCQVCN